MTLDEARKLKHGDKILVEDIPQIFIGITKLGKIVYEFEAYNDTGVYVISHQMISLPEPVYEWQWVYKRVTVPNCIIFDVTESHLSEKEAAADINIIQRVDSTKRLRKF